MSWGVDVTISSPTLRRQMEQQVLAAAGAVTAVIKGRVTRTKNNLRRQIESAGLGAGLANAIRGDTYPSRRGRVSLDTAGHVFSKAIVERPGVAPDGLVDVVSVLSAAHTVTRAGEGFLTIPTRDAPRMPAVAGQTRAPRVSDFPEGSLVPRLSADRTRGVLIHQGTGRIFFILQPSVTVSKKLNPQRPLRAMVAGVDGAIAREWTRRATRAGVR